MYVSLNFDSISIILDQVSYKFDFTLAHILPWFGPILPHEFEQIRQRNFTQARGAICNHGWKQREQQKYVYSRKQLSHLQVQSVYKEKKALKRKVPYCAFHWHKLLIVQFLLLVV